MTLCVSLKIVSHAGVKFALKYFQYFQQLDQKFNTLTHTQTLTLTLTHTNNTGLQLFSFEISKKNFKLIGDLHLD